MSLHIDIFQALADPARIRIVEAMKSGECAVGEIVAGMDIHQSGVSRHLRILAQAVRPQPVPILRSNRDAPFTDICKGAVLAGAHLRRLD
jgi:DNA-binding transcriptional ArsR family regulator